MQRRLWREAQIWREALNNSWRYLLTLTAENIYHCKRNVIHDLDAAWKFARAKITVTGRL
jgi:hypothetical protein